MKKSKKTIEPDFCKDCYFQDITHSQKLAIIHFLSVIAASDTNLKSHKEKFISGFYKEFGITGDLYLAYLAIGGREKMIEDIKSFSKDNLLDLVFATTEMWGFSYNGSMNVEDFIALENLLEDIGLNMDMWFDILESSGESEISRILAKRGGFFESF